MKRLLPVLAVLAAFAVPSVAAAHNSSGVVLKVDRSAHLIGVTQGPHHVSLVHTAAASRLRVGQRISLNARTLRNGTLTASRVRVVGRAHAVRFRGLVLARSHGKLVVSSGGAVISVRTAHRRSVSSARDGGPAVNTEVDVEAQVNDDELDAENIQTVSATSPGGKIEGTLTLGTGTVTVVSDQLALVLKVPLTGIDLTSLVAGQRVLATFTQGTDGSLTLTAISADDNAQQADEGDSGDNSGDNSDQDDGSGQGGSQGSDGGSGGSR